MDVAYLYAQRGTCSRRQVGAVIADQKGTIHSVGYNGALSGLPHCAPHDDYNACSVSEHAERNAVFFAARRGVSTEGLYLYSTDSPCIACARACVQSGIVRVVYDRPYKDDQGLVLLMAAGVEVVKYVGVKHEGLEVQE